MTRMAQSGHAELYSCPLLGVGISPNGAVYPAGFTVFSLGSIYKFSQSILTREINALAINMANRAYSHLG